MSETDSRLNLGKKLYQRSIFPKVDQVARGNRLARPLVVELDLTSACDFECPECISKELLNPGGFSRARLLRLGKELVEMGVKAVILIGGGEPLIHPAAGEVIRLLAEGGVAVGVTTNGTAIDRHRETLATCTAWVRVSVDAAAPATYGKFRPHRSAQSVFAKVIGNMRQLARVKKGALGYSMLLITRKDANGEVLETNLTEVYEAGILAKDIGCDYLEVKASYDMQHFLIPQPPSLVEKLRTQLAKLDGLVDGSFKVISPPNLNVILQHAASEEPKNYNFCPVSELRTLITPKGAYLCPYHRGKPDRAYGDPQSESVKSLWNGPQRKFVSERTRPCQDCRFHCIRHRSNLEILQIAEQRTCPEVVDDFDLFI